MKCIDAIEGTVKCILKKMHTDHLKNTADDSEYIQTVKTVIDATDQYIESNPECVDNPDILKQVLYVYSRNLWLIGQEPSHTGQSPYVDDLGKDSEEYQTYYYDYIYDQGVYPN